MGEWITKNGSFAKAVSQTVVELGPMSELEKKKVVAIEIAVSVVGATALCHAMEAIQKTTDQAPKQAFKPTITSGHPSVPVNMYNQGALTGAQKMEMLGAFTVEQIADGSTEKVNFDKQRMSVFAEFFKAAAPSANYREPKAYASIPEVQRYMGIFVLKMICTFATVLKDEIGEDDVPEWSELAFYNASSRPTACAGKWIQAMMSYLQSTLRPKTHLEMNMQIPVCDDDRIDRKEKTKKWVEDKFLKTQEQ